MSIFWLIAAEGLTASQGANMPLSSIQTSMKPDMLMGRRWCGDRFDHQALIALNIFQWLLNFHVSTGLWPSRIHSCCYCCCWWRPSSIDLSYTRWEASISLPQHSYWSFTKCSSLLTSATVQTNCVYSNNVNNKYEIVNYAVKNRGWTYRLPSVWCSDCSCRPL